MIRKKPDNPAYEGAMFIVGDYTLTIEGTDDKKIKLDGGATFSPAQDARITKVYNSDYSTTVTKVGKGWLIDCEGGNVYVDHAIMQNVSDGSAFYLHGGSTTPSRPECHVNHTLIKGIYRGTYGDSNSGGPAFYLQGGDLHEVYLYDVEIEYCDTNRYGAIGTSGDTGTVLTVDNCYLHDNRGVLGGAIFWTASGHPEAKCTIKGNTRICNNDAARLFNGNLDTDNGGAIYCEGTVEILSATISGNRAKNGGGISMGCFLGYLTTHLGSGFELTVTEGVTICNNTALNIGGGAHIELRSTPAIGFNPDNTPRTAEYKFELNGGSIYGNDARYGGGVGIDDHCPDYNTREVNSTTYTGGLLTKVVNVKSGQIYGNTAHSTTINGDTSNGLGGGIYLYRHDGNDSDNHVGQINVDISGGEVFQNVVGDGSGGSSGNGSGGGFYILNDYTGAALTSSVCNVKVSGTAEIYGNTCREYGAGIYLDRGTFEMTGGTIGKDGTTQVPGSSPAVYKSNKNVASQDGGGFYINGGSCSVKGGTISYNQAIRNGGGFYVNPGSGTSTLINSASAATTINNNEAANGAGVYVASGALYIRNEHASNVTTLKGNVATTNGGAIFMNGGNCTVEGGQSAGTATNPSIGISGEPNKAVLGAGIYATGGTTTIARGNIAYNQATNTGGNAGSGGGIYANGTVAFSNGSISHNTAIVDGGGVYISSTGNLQISGSATMTGNNVQTGQGGGVYQGNTMTANGTALTISGNTKGSATLTPNNVYLPDTKKITVGDDISPNVTMGITTQNTCADLSDQIPVLYSTNTTKLEAIYTAMTGGMSNIRDDRGIHRAKYTSDDLETIFFTKVQFDYSAYTSDFSNPIDSKEKMYQFMCWVNGLNGYGETHPDATGEVTANFSMSGITYWFPIGAPNVISSISAYTGTFNGNGYNIDDLTIDFNNGNGYDLIEDWGIFGVIDGTAQINDVMLKNINFKNKSNSGGVGTLVGKMLGGTVQRCSSGGILSANNSSCIMGGLVGINDGGTIHSSIATVTLEGYRRGGLVGDNSGYIYNCSARSNFKKNTSNTDFMGGLVGVNNGRVENCYSRMYTHYDQFEGITAKFGWIAGSNTAATNMGLYYCYAPDDETFTYIAAGGTSGNQVGLGTYGETQLPYTYKHRDSQVVVGTPAQNPYVSTDATADKQLLIALNKWVNQDASHSSTYVPWLRVWMKDNDSKAINGGFPVLRMPKVNSVACPNGSMVLRYYDINTNLDLYKANSTAAICFYGSKAGMDSNDGSEATLYIDEKAVLTPATSKVTGDIIAYVGITLDNSAGAGGANPSFGGGATDAIDWHFFSSVLNNATIGLVYNPPVTSVSYGTAPSQTTFDGTTNQYFPTNLNSFYNDWDLYAYYEPDYHWINLKRNSASHWHEDFDHGPITYTNPTVFNPGQGFLVATAEESYLQAYGTLNTGSNITVPVTYNSDVEWTTREGQNLLGNPYQSYLDFNAFATNTDNAALWTGSEDGPFYIIMDEDEDEADYVTYYVNQSSNTNRASRYLHPHQGFMIKVKQGGTVHFTDDMRTVSATSTFRGGDETDYPLVNLFAKDSHGNRDMVTVELGRPDNGGLLKSHVPGTSTGRLFCSYEGKSYDLAFTQPGLTEAAIRFTTKEDGEYTMTWNTQNGDFSYLHLIDNLTGTDIDCLTTDEYKFSALTSDYESRFRLVFDYTGIEENGEDGASASTTFAFMMGDQLVVNGEGTLQIFDVTGRLLLTAEVNGVQTTMPKPNTGAGIYLLRLTGVNGSKTQKIVIP